MDVVRPTVADTVVAPACGTGGFLLVAHEYAAQGAESMTPTQRDAACVTGSPVEDLTAALAEFEAVASALEAQPGDGIPE